MRGSRNVLPSLGLIDVMPQVVSREFLHLDLLARITPNLNLVHKIILKQTFPVHLPVYSKFGL